MWTYVDFAVFSCPVVQLHHVSDKRIESNQYNPMLKTVLSMTKPD